MKKKVFFLLLIITLAFLTGCTEYSPSWTSDDGFAINYLDYDDNGSLAPTGAVVFWGSENNVTSLKATALKGERVAFKAVPNGAFYELNGNFPQMIRSLLKILTV